MTSRTTAAPIPRCQYRPAALIPFATSVSHGVRTVASCCNIHVPARSSAARQGVRSAARNAPATRIAASPTQAVVVTAIRRGSGGGAPVGPPRRPRPPAAAPAPRLAVLAGGAPPSLLAPPAPVRSALAPGPSARPRRAAHGRPAPFGRSDRREPCRTGAPTGR